MANKARLETEITGSEVPFVNAVERAEKRATSFSHKFESLFARHQGPTRRIEMAMTGAVRDLASGNIVGAIESISTRMSGLGLAAGVGVGAAVAVWAKFQEQIAKTKKARDDLDKQLARPLAQQSALGPEGITKELENTFKVMDALVEERKGRISKIMRWWESLPVNRGPIATRTGSGDEGADQLAAGDEKALKLAEARVEAEKKIIELKKAGFGIGSSLEGLEKLALTRQQKVAALILDTQDRSMALQPSMIKRVGLAKEEEEVGRETIFRNYLDSFKLSLKELADIAKPTLVQGDESYNRSGEYFQAEGDLNRMSPLALYNAREARRAQQLLEKADYMERYQPDDQAGILRLRAEAAQIERPLSNLKQSEKDPLLGITTALDASAVLQDSRNSLSAILGELTRLSFANR